MKLIAHSVGLLVGAAAFVSSGVALSQTAEFPKTVTIVVPFAPGASNDTFARVLAQKLAPKLGVTVIVDNKPGAGGAIGAQHVARSKPDGATLMLTSSTFATNAAVSTNLPYDPVKAFAPVSMLASGPMILAVGNHTSYKSVADVIAAARAKKGDVTYGSAGIGSINQMAMELLNSTAKVEMTHVPYKGAGNAITDLMGGQLQMMFASFPSISGQVKAGKVRALAVTSPQKSKFAPDLPTVAATVPGYEVELWWGVFAPAATPPALVQRLNAEIRAIAETPDMQERFAQEGADPAATMSPDQFATYVSAEIDKWRRVAKERDIKVE